MIASAATPSRTLRERLSRPAAADAGALPAEQRERKLAAWCGAVTNSDWDAFRKRLAWDGLDPETAAAALLSPPAEDAGPAPWTAVLAEAYGEMPDACAAAFAACPPGDRALRAGEPLPFEPLFLPLLGWVRARLRARAGEAYALLEEGAHAALERWLLQRAAGVCARALFAEFAARRAIRQQFGGGAALSGGTDGGESPIFSGFLDEMRDGKLLRFFGAYPVAARLCARVAELWTDACAELLARLADDGPALEAAFGGGRPLGAVAEITTGASDPHNGGRTVLFVRWASGARVVYKPRPLGVDARFAKLLAWLEARAGIPGLRAPALVDRPTHGWVEFVEHLPCDGPEALARFYRRAGALLCATYALGGSDFHLENLIAAGEHPVLVDLETLLAPRLELSEQVASQEFPGDASRRAVLASVLGTCLLPHLKELDDGRTVDLGGLTGSFGETGEGVAVGWTGMNTDAMRLGRVRAAPRGGTRNRPVVDGEPARPAAYLDQIVDGFRAAYRAMLEGRDELLAPGGVLDRLRGERLRFVFRDTNLYATLLERSIHPDCLRDGAARGMQLDVLCRTLLTMDERPPVWPAIAAEQEALEELDVPFFTVPADSRDFPLPGGAVVRDCFRESAFEEMARRVRSLGEADLALQVDLIRGAFRVAEGRGLRVDAARPGPAPAPADAARLSERALARALEVAGRLRDRAMGPAGEASWLATGLLPRSRRYRTGPASAGLLDGYGGIALFLAAVERASGGAGLAGVALGALRPLAGRVDEVERLVRMRKSAQLGGGSGLGSAAYALACVAGLLDRPELLESARRIAALLTREAVAASPLPDVATGAAGALLAVLAVHVRAGDPALLARAAGIGEHLLEAREVEGGTGLRVWAAPGRGPETGFAHGQAGIAMAMRRLAHASGDARFAEAADEALRWERGALGAGLAAAAAEEAAAAWSHGATGIGIARLGGGALDAESAAEVETALSIARGRLFDGVDSLCCGTAARIELLLAAGERLGRPELAREAAKAAARVAAGRALRTGWEDDPQQVGLLHGEAGAAYVLLRAADPGSLPSLLLWE